VSSLALSWNRRLHLRNHSKPNPPLWETRTLQLNDLVGKGIIESSKSRFRARGDEACVNLMAARRVLGNDWEVNQGLEPKSWTV
jgi:hypothetical protein